jgi:HlyD family secretion protein
VGQAAIAQAKATVAGAEAALRRADRNLAFTVIKSPVRGVVIDRRVNIGQTVVASLNAPSLFLIAKDLGRMQVWVAVNEADIGNIHPGQPVSFTVDAYPGQTFKGSVNKVRLNASMTQNVVTYVVEVTTDNKDGKLLPYLTANVQFEVARREDVTMVPNAALRWLPQDDQIAPDARNQQPEQSERPTRGKRSTTRASEEKSGTVWMPDGDFVRPVRVAVGLSDGINTEVHAEALREGTQVVLGEERAQAAGAPSAPTNTNPFAPQMGRPGGGSGGRGRSRTP